MVTCTIDLNAKMNRQRRGRTSSNSSGFRLLDDQCDTVSSVSRNSIYKQKIDSMFDDSRYVISTDSFTCTYTWTFLIIWMTLNDSKCPTIPFRLNTINTYSTGNSRRVKYIKNHSVKTSSSGKKWCSGRYERRTTIVPCSVCVFRLVCIQTV